MLKGRVVAEAEVKHVVKYKPGSDVIANVLCADAARELVRIMLIGAPGGSDAS